MNIVVNKENVCAAAEGPERNQLKCEINSVRPRTDRGGYRDEGCGVALIGGGGYGLALSQLIASNMVGRSQERFNPIHVLFNAHSYDPDKHESARRKVEQFNTDRTCSSLSGVTMHRGLQATLDLEEALRNKSQILLVIPSTALMDFLPGFAETVAAMIQKGDLPPNFALTSAIKGLPDVVQERDHLIFPTDVISDTLRRVGVAIGGDNGVQVMCMHGAGFAKQMALGAPYSLTIGTKTQSEEGRWDRADELMKIMVKAKGIIEVAESQRDTIELGAIGKNFASLCTNFIVGYCVTRNYDYQGPFARSLENSLDEIFRFSREFGTSTMDPIRGFRAQREDVILSAAAPQKLPTGIEPPAGRNADFGLRVAMSNNMDQVLAEMSAQRKSQVTVEGLTVLKGLYDFIDLHGALDRYPLIRNLGYSIALRQPSNTVPNFSDKTDAQKEAIRQAVDKHLYQHAISGSHTTTWNFSGGGTHSANWNG